MTRPSVPRIWHRASSGRCGVQGTSQLWAIPISRLRGRGKAILSPDSLIVSKRAGQVLASRMVPRDRLHRPIDISTAASCQEARQSQGNRPELGKLPRRRCAFVRVLFCASLEKDRGPWKALNSAPGPNSSTPNFNLHTPQHQPKEMQRNHRDKKHPSGKPPPFPQTRLTSPCRPVPVARL